MRKTVSMEDGYSLFIEKNNNEIDCVAYPTGMPMKSTEVAKQLNISEGSISQSLRRSINKIYYDIRKNNRELSSLQIMCIMADLFNIKSQKEYKRFYKLFPKRIQGEVYEEARETGYTH